MGYLPLVDCRISFINSITVCCLNDLYIPSLVLPKYPVRRCIFWYSKTHNPKPLAEEIRVIGVFISTWDAYNRHQPSDPTVATRCLTYFCVGLLQSQCKPWTLLHPGRLTAETYKSPIFKGTSSSKPNLQKMMFQPLILRGFVLVGGCHPRGLQWNEYQTWFEKVINQTWHRGWDVSMPSYPIASMAIWTCIFRYIYHTSPLKTTKSR